MKTRTPTSEGRSKCFGYCRVSTEEQSETGISIEVQEARIRAWAAAKAVELVEVFTDRGQSGGKHPMKRPAMRAMLTLLRRGHAAGMIAVRLDRFSRSLRDVLDLTDECAREGWQFQSIQESIDTASDHGKLMVRLLATVAQFLRENTSTNTRYSMKHLGRELKAYSNRPPWGWRREGDDLVPVMAEQNVLARALELQAAGQGGSRIAKALGVNLRTKKRWTSGAIHVVLKHFHERRARLGVCTLTTAPGQVAAAYARDTRRADWTDVESARRVAPFPAAAYVSKEAL
jgi:site-specific DNA recombinase